MRQASRANGFKLTGQFLCRGLFDGITSGSLSAKEKEISSVLTARATYYKTLQKQTK